MQNDLEQIKRIQKMEKIFDRSRNAADKLLQALAKYRKLSTQTEQLIAYYDSPLWKKDYFDDEAGRIPDDVKRGVLSEDGIFDLIGDQRTIEYEMEQLLENIRGKNSES